MPLMGRSLRSYDAELIDRGLLMLAVCAGDAAQAHRRLAADGHDVPERTLRAWKTDTHPQRYVDLQAAHSAKLEGVLIEGARASALMATRLEQAALQLATEQVEAGEARDPATIARNAAVAKGINVDQVLKLSGRPTVVAEVRNADDLLDIIAAKLGEVEAGPVVDAVAVEATSG